MDNRTDHFAHCVQLCGGATAFSRRLGIDERAVRRFANGERPISDGLLRDTAAALRALGEEMAVAAKVISAGLAAE